jgi:hypothetical protein
MAKKAKKAQAEVVGFLGVGLDSEDGHQRITNNENFLLVGGSAETHERMQDVSIYFNEELGKRGKRLRDAEVKEALDLLREALDR